MTSKTFDQVAMVVSTGDDIITAASNTLQENIVPIFCVSAVTGKGTVFNTGTKVALRKVGL